MSMDLNLLFAVLALQLEFIDRGQFTTACQAWAADKETPLAEVLTARGWLNADERQEVQRLVDRKLARHDGNPNRALRDAADASLRNLLRGIKDEDVDRTVSFLGPTADYVQLSDEIAISQDELSYYTLTKFHTQGGLGRVWRARDSRLQREVALKEIRPDVPSDERARQRFVREAQITGQLQHPNIVPIYALSRAPDSDRPFYTMRFIEGDTLNTAIEKYYERRKQGLAEPLELQRLLTTFVSICQAMSYAHSRGIVHRDLKPANIMLGEFGEVVVLDWGLAKQVGESADLEVQQPLEDLDRANAPDLTEEGQVVGTPPYMAPEQAAGHLTEVDHRTDIYGLGAILFRILTGQRPHRGASSKEVVARILEHPTPEARSAEATVPGALNAICRTAMAKERDRRYQDAADLAMDVQRWLADEPVSVYVEPWHERAGRWARKHRTFTRATLTSVLLVALVACVAAFLINRARLGERTAKAAALAHFRQALDTVDAMLTGVSETLKYYPGTQQLCVKLLEEAADAYQGFAAEPSADLGLRVESGRTYLRLGEVYRRLQLLGEAAEAYSQAASIFTPLAPQGPPDVDVRLELALCHWKLAEVQTLQGSVDTARTEYDQAEAWLRQARSHLDRGLNRALILASRAEAERKQDQIPQALAMLTEADAELTALGPAAGLKGHECTVLVRTLLASVLTSAGQNREAIEPLQRAIESCTALLTNQPDYPPYLEGRAFASLNLANALAPIGQVERELVAYQQAVDDFDRLSHAMPDVPRFHENLLLAGAGLARLRHVRQQNREAQRLLAPFLPQLAALADAYADPDHYQRLAFVRTILGQVLRDLDDREGADEQLYLATQIYVEHLLVGEKIPVRYRLDAASAGRQVGQLYQLAGRHEDAEREFQTSLATLTQLLQQNPLDPYVRDELAVCQETLGDLRLEQQQLAAAQEHFAQAAGIREELNELPRHRHRLAEVLIKLQSPQEHARAVAIAQGLCRELPGNPDFQTTLGAALLRLGKVSDSIPALLAVDAAQASSEREFCLAQAYARRGAKGDLAESKAAYERGCNRMSTEAPGNLRLRRLRLETAQVLGLPTTAKTPPADSTRPPN